MDFETILVGLVLNMLILTLLRLFENRSIQIVVHSCTSFGQEDEEEEEDSTDEEESPADSLECKPTPLSETSTFVGVSRSEGSIVNVK